MGVSRSRKDEDDCSEVRGWDRQLGMVPSASPFEACQACGRSQPEEQCSRRDARGMKNSRRARPTWRSAVYMSNYLLYFSSSSSCTTTRLLPIPGQAMSPQSPLLCKIYHLQPNAISQPAHLDYTAPYEDFRRQRGSKPQARQPLPTDGADPRSFIPIPSPSQVVHFPVIRRPCHVRLFLDRRLRCGGTRSGERLAVFC